MDTGQEGYIEQYIFKIASVYSNQFAGGVRWSVKRLTGFRSEVEDPGSAQQRPNRSLGEPRDLRLGY
jgi:hypothetical protein